MQIVNAATTPALKIDDLNLQNLHSKSVIFDVILTLSVLSLMWSIVYVAGKGLMGYIHVQTMLTSPAIPGLLFLTIPKCNYLF